MASKWHESVMASMASMKCEISISASIITAQCGGVMSMSASAMVAIMAIIIM